MAATTHERPPMYQRLAIDTVLEVRTRRRRKAARRARASPSTDDIYDFSPDSASTSSPPAPAIKRPSASYPDMSSIVGIHTTDLFDFDLKSIWSQKSYLDSDSEDEDDAASSSSSSSSSLSPRSPASDAAPSPLSAHSPASFFPRPSSPLSYLPTDPDWDTLRLDDLTRSLKPPSPFDEPAPSYDDATSAIRPPPPSSSTTPWDFDPSLLASLDPHLLADPWDALATFFWDSLAPEPEPAPSPSPSPPTPSHSHPRPHPQPRQLWTTAARAPARSTPDFAATFDAWERLAPTDPLPGPVRPLSPVSHLPSPSPTSAPRPPGPRPSRRLHTASSSSLPLRTIPTLCFPRTDSSPSSSPQSTGDNKPLPSLPPPSPLYALSLLSRSQASFTNPFPTNPFPTHPSDPHPHILHSQFPPHPDPPSDYAHAHLATAAAIALVPRRPSEPAYLFLDPPPSSSSSPDPDPELAPTHAPGHARAKSAGQQVGAGGLRWLAGRFGMGGGGGTGKGKENVGLGQGVGSDPGAGEEGGMEEDGVRGVGW
ncbi:hypothetical protein OF83DRAFT_1170748 [Amylostereum chailletii]|nr:hypothetical protein OF83DRAFT_1170748 [Amylostereum chailletii]